MMLRTPLLVGLVLAASGCSAPAPGPTALSRITVVAAPDGTRTVTVPACPDWSRSSREDFSNRVASNFGCADALNFVGQLADPLDAVRGRSGGAQDAGLATRAIERYRARKTAPLTGEGSRGASEAMAPGGER